MNAPIAASLIRQATADLATSALPGAPVQPEAGPPRRRAHRRLRTPLARRLARRPARRRAAAA